MKANYHDPKNNRLWNSHLPDFAGNFRVKNHEATLHKLSDYDVQSIRHYKFKQEEKIFRYTTDSMLGHYKPFIKVNIERGLVYYLTDRAIEEDITEFEGRGVKCEYLNLLGE